MRGSTLESAGSFGYLWVEVGQDTVAKPTEVDCFRLGGEAGKSNAIGQLRAGNASPCTGKRISLNSKIVSLETVLNFLT